MKSLIQGFLTGTRGKARVLAPRLVESSRFSRHLNTPREISPSGEGSPAWGFKSPSDTWGLKSLGTQAPGFGGCLRVRPRHHARAPLDPARAMRSHRRGENVVTITSIQPRSTNSARAMMHSARDLQTRLRIDLAIPIGSAIEPVPHAHVQETADRRPGAGPGLLWTPHKKPRPWTRSPRSVWCTRTCPLALANTWLAIQGPLCSEGPARQCFP